jgi:hypothetical protein
MSVLITVAYPDQATAETGAAAADGALRGGLIDLIFRPPRESEQRLQEAPDATAHA